MLDSLLEIVGFLLLVAFAFCVWPPAALGVAGAGLLLRSFVGDDGTTS